jgi:pre-mRNA 3'-end-processing factor FIP1
MEDEELSSDSASSTSSIEIILGKDEEQEKEKEKERPLMRGMPIPRVDSSAPKTFDIEAHGEFDGVDIFDVDIDTFEDKPWRKPGADITDYFNFGFNENSWKAYSTKQRIIRDEIAMQQRFY